jgi:hypothetical protein
VSHRKAPSSILVTIIALAVAGVLAASGLAAKNPSSSSPTLDVSFPAVGFASATSGTSVAYATPYLVSGCGYGTAGVTVVVHSPEAISFAGQLPDANGCISVSNFSTQGAGHYQVDAYQTVRKRDVIVASTSFDLS